jgi:hypothetical protein
MPAIDPNQPPAEGPFDAAQLDQEPAV